MTLPLYIYLKKKKVLMLHLIIRGKWKSPNHSTDRKKDDTHEIKEEILKEAGRRIFEKRVGKNPDLDIDPLTEKIRLKGRGAQSKEIFETDINADDYFIQTFICTGYKSYFYRSIEDSGNTNYYAIPPDIEMLSLLLEHIFTQDNGREFFIEIII